MEAEYVQEVSKSTLSKTDVRYWMSSIHKATYPSQNGVKEVSEWRVKLQYKGRRKGIRLQTAHKRQAATKARDIYLSLRTHGWEKTLEEFDPTYRRPSAETSVDSNPQEETKPLSVGDFLTAAKAVSTVDSKTIEEYCRAFRTIVSNAVLNDYRGEKQKRELSLSEWQKQVEGVSLSRVTPSLISQWKIDYVRRNSGDPVQLRRARNNVNATIRKAKSLFSKKLLPLIELDLPQPLPFEGVKFEPRTSMRYRSGFDFEETLELAINGSDERKIKPLPFEQWKIFLLASMAGLRRNEIDKLEWSAFKWESCVISIQATSSFHPKSEESLADVEVDPEFMELFQKYQGETAGAFVIDSPVAVRLETKYFHYRAEKHFRGLLHWLRAAGVPGDCKIHTLRKEYGSQMCAKHGIYAASRALRHADIHITSMHYLDKRERSTLGMGSLLKKASANGPSQ